MKKRRRTIPLMFYVTPEERNQIEAKMAQLANETGRIYPEDLADIRQNQAQLWESAKEILRVLSTLD